MTGLPMKLVLLAVPLALASCGPQGEAAPAAVDVKAEEARLMQASRDWSALAAAGKDVDAVAAYWADDAVLMQDNVPTLRGRAAVREMVAGAFKTPGFKIEWEPLEAHVSASGDMGYILERSTVTEPGANGGPVIHRMRAITVWRKDATGAWRNVADMSNAEPGAASEAAEP